MGLPLHIRGEAWPKCPFITCTLYGAESGTWIRWNNLDCHKALGDPLEGNLQHETVEFWEPSQKIDQAMRLWRSYPPERHWVQVQVGKDGWTVELLYHDVKVVYIKTLIADDDTNDSMAKAITKAWITAMEAT